MEGQAEAQRKKTCKDYSLAFKLRVVAEVEQGEITWHDAQGKYGIQGNSTVLVWLRKHGRLDWRGANPMKDKSTPHHRIRELEKRLKRLEEEKEILNRAIDLADAQLKTDIRKKYLALLSEATSGQRGSLLGKTSDPDHDTKGVTASG
jgi:transposase